MISPFPPRGDRPFGNIFRLDHLSGRTEPPPAMTALRASFTRRAD